MYKGIPYSNNIIKRRQQQRVQQQHKLNLRNIRPLTTNIDIPFEVVQNPYVNNKKKDMLQQDRFTQIERQNRMLLQKIHTIMNKKPDFKVQKIKRNNSINNDKHKINKSLNNGYRRKQLEDIQIQNAKLLRRLMDKKSDYQAKKLKQQWKKQKTVIKNIANYPFIIRDKIYKGRRKSLTSQSFNHTAFTTHTGAFTATGQANNTLSSPIQLVRIRNLGGQNFLITVKYDGNTLQILGDNKSTKQIKIIEIPKQQGLQFIQFQCDGKIDKIFDCLRYDKDQKVLYLVGKDVDLVTNHNSLQNQEQRQEKYVRKQHQPQNEIQNHNEIISKQKSQQQVQKGLKKRQMSNIYEIQNSQLQTEPNKKTQNNLNFTHIQEVQQNKLQNQIPNHIKSIHDENKYKQKSDFIKVQQKEVDEKSQKLQTNTQKKVSEIISISQTNRAHSKLLQHNNQINQIVQQEKINQHQQITNQHLNNQIKLQNNLQETIS